MVDHAVNLDGVIDVNKIKYHHGQYELTRSGFVGIDAGHEGKIRIAGDVNVKSGMVITAAKKIDYVDDGRINTTIKLDMNTNDIPKSLPLPSIPR